MPRYAYQKPRAKVYAYNFGYMNNYYKPMTHYLSKEGSVPSDRPGAQSLAEVTENESYYKKFMVSRYRSLSNYYN